MNQKNKCKTSNYKLTQKNIDKFHDVRLLGHKTKNISKNREMEVTNIFASKDTVNKVQSTILIIKNQVIHLKNQPLEQKFFPK